MTTYRHRFEREAEAYELDAAGRTACQARDRARNLLNAIVRGQEGWKLVRQTRAETT